MLFQRQFSGWIVIKFIKDVIKYFLEDYHFANLDYCSMLVNGAMNPGELQEYIHRDENIMLDYKKCEKLWNFYRKYYNEIKYLFQLEGMTNQIITEINN